jgi:uncharacterized protein
VARQISPLVIRNLTRDTILATRAEEARGLWRRGWGLLGRGGLAPGEGLIIAPCRSIHSWFMRFRFDALFFTPDGTVCHTIEAMPAWRFSRFVHRARGVIELPAGTLAATGTRGGDRVAWGVEP